MEQSDFGAGDYLFGFIVLSALIFGLLKLMKWPTSWALVTAGVVSFMITIYTLMSVKG